MSGNAPIGAGLVFALAVTYAFFVALLQRQKPPSETMKRLALEIRRQVIKLTEEGNEFLVPQDSDGVIARLIVSAEDGAAIIEQCNWGVGDRIYSDTRFKYIITAEGQVTRRITGRDLNNDDRLWCHERLTCRRLEKLLVMTRGYSPRSEMSRHR